jgi:hypothetical protein
MMRLARLRAGIRGQAAPTKTCALNDVPLPSDYNEMSLSSTGIKSNDAYLGAWVGAWEDFKYHTAMCQTLIVRTKGRSVEVVYAAGDNSARGYTPKYRKIVGKFKDGKLIVDLRYDFGAIAEYNLVNGHLEGRYIDYNGGVTTAMLMPQSGSR